jgi:hypothetical protein
MKGLFIALKCFMLEFWDLKQYAPTWNTTTLDYLDKLPRNAEAKCIHLPEATRICQLKVKIFFFFRLFELNLCGQRQSASTCLRQHVSASSR